MIKKEKQHLPQLENIRSSIQILLGKNRDFYLEVSYDDNKETLKIIF